MRTDTGQVSSSFLHRTAPHQGVKSLPLVLGLGRDPHRSCDLCGKLRVLLIL
jgi:hypothetical protein